jgi:FkbM family methyltransferase
MTTGVSNLYRSARRALAGSHRAFAGAAVTDRRAESATVSALPSDPTEQDRLLMAVDYATVAPRSRAKLGDKLAAVPLEVPCRDGSLLFLNVSTGSYSRGARLHKMEPDTLRWIDRMQPGGVFWDIGANVGVYSLYAAQRGDLDVHAFEPAAVNHYLLSANCELNDFFGVMRSYLLGFSDRTTVASIEASQLAPGESFSFRGKGRFEGRQTCLLFSIDDFLEQFHVPFPNYVKIDVPYGTDAILVGAAGALARPELREIQLETSADTAEGRTILELVEPYGFGVVARNRRTDGSVREVVLGRSATVEAPG